MEMRVSGSVFICGEGNSYDRDSMPSTKSVLLVNLSANWPVRTHCEANAIDPRSDKGTLFRRIASSYVFVFIFTEETTTNPYYLNQLGTAFARGIPIIGVREPSYIMPNPLPEHYYSTEIIDLTESKPNNGRNKPNGRGKAILSNLLIDSFRNAVVYTADFHKHCLERLVRKVTDAYNETEKEKNFPPNLTVTDFGRMSTKGAETIRQKIWTSVGGFKKCPTCGSQVKVNQKTSTLRKTNSVDNLLKDTSRAPPRYRLDAPQLMITKSVLQPVVLQPNFSKAVFQAGWRRPATSVARKSSSAKSAPRETTITRDTVYESRPVSSKSCNAIPGSYSLLEDAKMMEAEDAGARRDIVAEIATVKANDEPVVRRKTSRTGFITNKRGAFLRKMSSLPCIPTTYLVTEPGSEKHAFVKYPPVDGNLSDGVPEFTDDEDKETIHISRRPSPAISSCSTNIESE